MSLLTSTLLAQVSFQEKTLTEINGKPKIADVDGDGKNDIVFRGREVMSWFQYPDLTSHPISKGAYFGDRYDVVDMDQDGDLDIVTGIDREKSTVYWIENPAPEKKPQNVKTWQQHLIGTQGDYIKDLFGRDIDNDGKIDIIARCHGFTKIYFRQAGQWVEKKIEHPWKEGMDIADLDKDGDQDLVLNGFWLETPEDPKTGEYIFHNISEKWYKQDTPWWRDNCAYVAIDDIDGDGFLDVAFSHSETTGYPIAWYSVDNLEQLKRDQWAEHIVVERFDWCETLRIGDIDNDGYPDIIAAEFERDKGNKTHRNSPPYPISVFYNGNGDGSEWHRQDISNQGIYAGELGDIGSDGDLDIIGQKSYWIGPVKFWENQSGDAGLALDAWQHIQVDSTRERYVYPGGADWWRWFGLDMADITHDGYADIASGKYFYRNPGGDMTGAWPRVQFPIEVDAMIIIDVDDDAYGDVIGLAQPDVFWLEAKDYQASSWSVLSIGELPGGDHGNTQLYSKAQIVPGGKEEIVLGSTDGLYYFEVPNYPGSGNWPKTRITPENAGYATGDIDNDGYIDIAGTMPNPAAPDSIVPGTRNVRWDQDLITWWKNPGNGSRAWQHYTVGIATHADRFAMADLNGDKKLDIIITEERYPGHVANSDLFWYEQPADPAKSNWTRHHVVRQQSTNNLDVADMDRDGDNDIIVCEHNMPFNNAQAPGYGKEKLQIWENDGRGNFTERIVDVGKESHLGSQVHDMDGDGDPDIVSIAWRDYQNLHLWRNDAIRQTQTPTHSPMAKKGGTYVIPISVAANGYDRFDKPVEFNINVTDMVHRVAGEMAFTHKSMRLVEVSSNGMVIDDVVPYQFETRDDYDPKTRAVGTLVFIMDGHTAAGAERYYQLYLDAAGDGGNNSGKSLLQIEELSEYEGDSAFKITTPGATYYYHKHGSGFASLLDAAGRDWVSFHPNEEPDDGFKGRYRGIPNIAPPGFHPGRGDGKKASKVTQSGPIKIRIMSETEDEKWGCYWDIYPKYATMTLFKKDNQPYWILYEGTPGGSFENDRDFWMNSEGDTVLCKDYMRTPEKRISWAEDLPNPEWVVFGDKTINTRMFYIHHESEDAVDCYWNRQDGGMTVFGFGRDPEKSGESGWQKLNSIPTHLTLGFSEASTHEGLKKEIDSAFRPVKLSVGEPFAR
jgi:hypothetical protein